MLAPVPRGHSFPTEAALLSHARTLQGATSGELAAAVGAQHFNAAEKARGKTGVGALVELYLGRPQNNSREPDIAELGIEVKTLPLEKKGRAKKAWGPKEPTTITMIDYSRVLKEEWSTAYVRKKLHRILWVPYVHNFDDKRGHVFREPFCWSPDPEDLPQYREDYEIVRSYIERREAHKLSESLCVILAARRKGAKDEMRAQPNSRVPAKSRAWALRSPYTQVVLDRHFGLGSISILELAERVRRRRIHKKRLLRLADVTTLQGALDFVLQELKEYEGRNTTAIARELSGRMERSKNRHSAVVRAIIGLPRRGNVLELEKLGIRFHVVDARKSDSCPFEAVPFPAMILRTFVEEEWGDSQLVDHIDRIIFVPTYSATGSLDEPHELGRAFLWKPSPEDWVIIEKEWRSYQRVVQECRLEDAPDESETARIHMRPHGRRGMDVDEDPCGNKITKQCFWLNKRFVQRVLRDRAHAATADSI